MAEVLSPRQVEDLGPATKLAEHGNGSRIRDMLQNESDLAEHNKVIKAMLNLNQQHLTDFQIMESQGLKPSPVSRLKFDEVKKDQNGEVIIHRTLSSDGRAIYREIYNDSKKRFDDPGSCPNPTGILPPFLQERLRK